MQQRRLEQVVVAGVRMQRGCQNKHLTWSEPVPKLSSPHSEQRPSSIRLPKNFLWGKQCEVNG